MKIITAFTMIGKGDILLTDEPFSAKLGRQVRSKKKLRFAEDGQVVEIDIKAAEGAKKADGEFLSFVVPAVTDGVRAFIVGRDCELV
jgi:hypothetical protein